VAGDNIRGRRSVAQRSNAEPVERRQRALHVGAFLGRRLATGLDVRVGVVRDLVAGGEDRLALGRERLDRVTRDEERRRQTQRAEAFEHPRHAHARPVLSALQHRLGHALVAESHG
jgi:hypothetical protein